MFDTALHTHLQSPITKLCSYLHKAGITANQLTFIGFFFGVLAGIFIIFGFYQVGLGLFLLNRLFDGLDGGLARLQSPTDKGGFLDIVADFLIYSWIPFSFALANDERALAAAFLIFSFIGTGSSFLAYAIIEAKRPQKGSSASKAKTPKTAKSFFYLGGLTEGAETILALSLACLFPAYFSLIAIVFGLMCWLTTISRIYMGWIDFQD